jgi:hypothetical protein
LNAALGWVRRGGGERREERRGVRGEGGRLSALTPPQFAGHPKSPHSTPACAGWSPPPPT